MTAIPDRIFKKPEVLTEDSQILGIPANDWNRVLLGDMEKELQRQGASIPAEESSIPAHDQPTG